MRFERRYAAERSVAHVMECVAAVPRPSFILFLSLFLHPSLQPWCAEILQKAGDGRIVPSPPRFCVVSSLGTAHGF